MLVNFAEAVTITRYSPGDFVDGEWEYGSYDGDTFEPVAEGEESEEIEISAHIQPMNVGSRGDRELMVTLGLQSFGGAVRVLSNDEIKTVSKSARTRADVLHWNGETYDLKFVSYHPKFPPAHWMGVGVLVDEKAAY